MSSVVAAPPAFGPVACGMALPTLPSLVRGGAPGVDFRLVLARDRAALRPAPQDPRSTSPMRGPHSTLSGRHVPAGTDENPNPPPSRDRAAANADELQARRHAVVVSDPPWLAVVHAQVSYFIVPAATSPRAAASLEDLLPALVRRVAWSRDAKGGRALLEIGSGELAGATLLVHTDGDRVRVELSTPPGVDVSSWRERIVRRLAARNIPIDQVEVA
jgi:hypothetical protein